jgi:general secretion pathway protein K
VNTSDQKGVAVITALLLTALAITIVAGLFWQQQVQLRLIDNQRFRAQEEWLLRDVLDWACLILRDDGRTSSLDFDGEAWSRTLTAQSTVPAGGLAAVRGDVSDAQARFNLTNLGNDGKVDPKETAVFARLLTSLRINPQLALAAAQSIAASQRAAVTGNVDDMTGMRIWQVDDLLAIPGFTPDMLPRLQNLVVALPRATPLNLNTASAQIIAAKFENMSLANAAALVASRRHAYFRDAADFAQRLPGTALPSDLGSIAFASNFFIVRSAVDMQQSQLQSLALIERTGAKTKVLWIREEEAS